MSPREKENTERISTFLPREMVEFLRKEAAIKGLNLSSLMRMVLSEHVRKAGMLIEVPHSTVYGAYGKKHDTHDGNQAYLYAMSSAKKAYEDAYRAAYEARYNEYLQHMPDDTSGARTEGHSAGKEAGELAVQEYAKDH